jgi:hypothetical protein
MSAPAIKLLVLPDIKTIPLTLSFFDTSPNADVNSGNNSLLRVFCFTFGESILITAISLSYFI